MELLGVLGLFVACLGVLLWSLQQSGVYDVKTAAQPILARLPFVGYGLAEERLTPQEIQKRELERIQESITEKEQVLANKELELSEREKALKMEADVIEQRRRQVRELETKLNEQEKLDEDRDLRINRLVEIYTVMPPDAAAKQIEAQNDDLALEILQRMKTDVVAIILAQMSKERAGSLTLKMGKPESVTQ